MIQSIIGREFPDKVIPLIQNAQHTIKVIVFDWRLYPNDPANSVQIFNSAIAGACRRGVAVSCIANHTDIISALKTIGCEAKKLSAPNLVHVKMMLIDDKILVVGSHNYTQHAFTMNYELSVIIDDQPDLSRFTDFFNNLWQQ